MITVKVEDVEILPGMTTRKKIIGEVKLGEETFKGSVEADNDVVDIVGSHIEGFLMNFKKEEKDE